MKKFFLIFFVILSFFLLFNKDLVNAQTPVPTGITPFPTIPFIGSVEIPGVTCGKASSADPNVQKCCGPPNFNFNFGGTSGLLPDDLGCLINVGGAHGFCIGEAINKLLNFISSAGPVKDIQKFINDKTSTGYQKVNPCLEGNPKASAGQCTCVVEKASTAFLCEYLTDPAEKSKCVSECSDKGVWTAIGCVYSDVGQFITEKVFGFGVGLAGVIALLCIIYGAFTLQTSRGEPEKIKKAQELLTSCIMGLMLIIFSVFILKFIGVDILRIPGFGK